MTCLHHLPGGFSASNPAAPEAHQERFEQRAGDTALLPPLLPGDSGRGSQASELSEHTGDSSVRAGLGAAAPRTDERVHRAPCPAGLPEAWPCWLPSSLDEALLETHSSSPAALSGHFPRLAKHRFP